MHIYTTCACGKALRVGRNFAGRKIRCPECQKICAVPTNGDTGRLEDQASAILLSGASRPGKSIQPKSRADLSRTPPPPTRKGLPDLVVDQIPTNQQFLPASRIQPESTEEEEGIGSIHPRTLGGILLAAIAISWLGSGYAPGWYFIFPGIVLGFGFWSVVKGIFPVD